MEALDYCSAFDTKWNEVLTTSEIIKLKTLFWFLNHYVRGFFSRNLMNIININVIRFTLSNIHL